MMSCPTGYFRPTRGGIQYTDCTSCEPGFLCAKNQEPVECPAGFYCLLESKEATPCPKGTYSDKTQLITMAECKDCPAGYYCNAVNITDFKKFPCPAGKYCLSKSLNPINCPGGTYRSMVGGKGEGDCADCPAGSYCPEGSVTHIKCKGATNCPEKSKYFATCRGGYYCNADTNY